jgi:hypothetical protein
MKTVCCVAFRIEHGDVSQSKLPHLPAEMWQLVLSFVHFTDV